MTSVMKLAFLERFASPKYLIFEELGAGKGNRTLMAITKFFAAIPWQLLRTRCDDRLPADVIVSTPRCQPRRGDRHAALAICQLRKGLGIDIPAAGLFSEIEERGLANS